MGVMIITSLFTKITSRRLIVESTRIRSSRLDDDLGVVLSFVSSSCIYMFM